jgi:hypothetical protein
LLIKALDTAHRIGLLERCLLAELGFPQNPTTLAIDNTAAITVMSGAHPGKYSGVKHIARRFFACQEERLLRHFILRHIVGTINPADFIYLRDVVQGQQFPELYYRAMSALTRL